MNLARLMILGLMTHLGPLHGHQVRRVAERTEVAGWGGVSFSALYRELRLMEENGLIAPVRTEQVGLRPARTVYQITTEGRRELRSLWSQAIRDRSHGPDVLSVALLFGRVLDRAELTEAMRARRGEIADVLAFVSAERARGQADGTLGPIDAAVYRRGESRLEAELRWHDEFAQVLACMPEEAKPTAAKGRSKTTRTPSAESEKKKTSGAKRTPKGRRKS